LDFWFENITSGNPGRATNMRFEPELGKVPFVEIIGILK
jgi:hypothetical protein